MSLQSPFRPSQALAVWEPPLMGTCERAPIRSSSEVAALTVKGGGVFTPPPFSGNVQGGSSNRHPCLGACLLEVSLRQQPHWQRQESFHPSYHHHPSLAMSHASSPRRGKSTHSPPTCASMQWDLLGLDVHGPGPFRSRLEIGGICGLFSGWYLPALQIPTYYLPYTLGPVITMTVLETLSQL